MTGCEPHQPGGDKGGCERRPFQREEEDWGQMGGGVGRGVHKAGGSDKAGAGLQTIVTLVLAPFGETTDEQENDSFSTSPTGRCRALLTVQA